MGHGQSFAASVWGPSHQAVKIPQQTELVDEDAMSQIRKGHDTMCVVLTSRHKNLDTVRAMWTTGDIKASACPAPAPGLGLNREEGHRKLGRRGRPCHHTAVDLVSSVLIITSCHLLSSCLWAWPCTDCWSYRYPTINPIVTPRQGHYVPGPLRRVLCLHRRQWTRPWPSMTCQW